MDEDQTRVGGNALRESWGTYQFLVEKFFKKINLPAIVLCDVIYIWNMPFSVIVYRCFRRSNVLDGKMYV